jgi:hypothetical protein
MHGVRARRAHTAERVVVAGLAPTAYDGNPRSAAQASAPRLRPAGKGRVNQVGRELARRLRPETRCLELRTKD